MRHLGASGAALVLAVLLVVGLAPADENAALDECTAYLAKAKQTLGAMSSYQGTIAFRERIKGKLREVENVEFLIVEKPERFLLKWNKGLYEGLIVSRVAERDGDRHLRGRGHGFRGLPGFQHLAFDSAMIKNFYPHHFELDQYTLGALLRRITRIFNRARELGKITVADKGIAPDAQSGVKLRTFDAKLSPNAADGLEFSRAVIGFEPQTALPRAIQVYDFDGNLFADHHVLTFKANVPVNDEMFNYKQL